MRYTGGVLRRDQPLTPMQLAAYSLHELFTTLQQAGFSEAQALVLIGNLMERTAHGGHSND